MIHKMSPDATFCDDNCPSSVLAQVPHLSQEEGPNMSPNSGSGEFKYEALTGWEKLPDGVRLKECPGVAVDSNDNVYVMTRNTDHPFHLCRIGHG